MKLLFLTNGFEVDDYIGPWESLNRMVHSGELDQVELFPFIVENNKNKNWQVTLNEINEIVMDFAPDLILTSHISNYEFGEAFFTNCTRNAEKKVVFGYDERDVYGYVHKPMPMNLLNFSRRSDVTFVVASGSYANRFRKNGSTNVIFAPHVANLTLFGKEWNPTQERDYDVILIGNLITSRLPFLSVPGSQDRKQLAEALSKEYGPKFAVFGKGWGDAPYSKGPTPYRDQEIVNRRSRITIGLDHFSSYENYFSDRLPIALLSGVPHISKRTPGIENFFTNGYHCFFFSSIKEAVSLSRDLLQKGNEYLDQIGTQASDYVRQNFTEDIRMNFLIQKMKLIYETKNA